MFSRSLWNRFTIATVTASVLLAGCNSKIGEKPPEEAVQEFSGTQCLTKAKPVFAKFITSDATPGELHRSWDCVVVALEKFKKYVRGSDRDKFTPQELATFLEKNFMDTSDGVVFSPKLQTEVMKLKGLLIGGSHSHLTIEEINKIVTLIGKLRTISIDILPYMKVVSMNWKPAKMPATNSELEYFEAANLGLQKAAKELSVVIEENGQSYVIADFAVLLEELANTFGEKWTSPDFIRKYLTVVKKLKKAVAGGNESTIVPSEWKRFILLGARGYVQFLRYENFIKDLSPADKKLKNAYFNKVVDDALSAIEDILSEKPSGAIAKSELYELVQAFSLVRPDIKMSEAFFNEALKIKILLVGGAEDSLSVKDVSTLKTKAPKLVGLWDGIKPHLDILALIWQPTQTSFEKAEKTLAVTTVAFNSWLVDALGLLEGGYDLNRLPNLIREYEKLYGPSKSSLAKDVSDYLPLIIDFKKMMFGDGSSVVKKTQWNTTAKVVAGGYGEFLYYNYFVKGRSLQKPQGISAFSNSGHSILTFLRQLVKLKHNEFFARDELLTVVNFLAKKGVIPASFRGSIADQALDVVLNNVLVTPERRLAGKKPNALNLSALEAARAEFATWIDAEILWVRAASGWTSPTYGYSASQLYNYLREVSGSRSSSDALKLAARELMLAVNSPYPIVTDERGFLRINNRVEQLYTFKSLRDLNRNRMVARLMIRAFSNDLDRIKSYKGAVLSEVQAGFDKLRGIFIKIGLLDPNNLTFAKSRFTEANIFTPHADGNNYASQAEITDLVGMIISGVNIHTQLRDHLVRNCFPRRATITDASLVSVECVKTAYKPAMARTMTATPEYLAYMKRVPDSTWSVYMHNVFMATGYIPNEKGLAKMGDITLTPHVVQYIEMIFAKFDANKDTYISATEAIRAYPSFDALMKDIAKDMLAAGDIKESELLDIFTFILKYGHPPTTLKEKAKYFFSWKGKRDKWDVAADRTQLALILGYIAEQSNK